MQKKTQKETNMIQPWFIQFCIISVSTLINKWFKFNYICNTKRWNFLQIFIKSQIIHDFVWMYMWKFLCWFYIQNAFERLNYKITKRNIHFRLLLIFFKFQFKIKKKRLNLWAGNHISFDYNFDGNEKGYKNHKVWSFWKMSNE